MPAHITTDIRGDLSLLRLLQLVSPALPVGAFAYSQAMEWAVENGWLTNAAQTFQWINGLLHYAQARLDVPAFKRLYMARQEGRPEGFDFWNRYLLASRGSRELQQEDRHMGRALQRLLENLLPAAHGSRSIDTPCFAAMFAVAACDWEIDLADACAGMLWAWAENQVAAAVKLVPLGQTEGQTILMQLADQIPGAMDAGLALETEDMGALCPGQAMASAGHESQHTRLFRS